MLHGLQYLNDEDVEIDPILLKAERRSWKQKETKDRKKTFSHGAGEEYAKRLYEAGLGPILDEYIKKG